MIEIKQLTKAFDQTVAVDSLDLTVENGTVLGLVGSNGGGKSTLLRMLSGVYRADKGEIKIDGQDVYDNPDVKGECFFVSDFPYFYNTSTLSNTASLYRDIYPNWSEEAYERYCKTFPIDRNRRIINMSKGMQRQAALILALSTCPKYLFLDEIFDGLDAVIRLTLKKILIERVADHSMTIIIASHNLRELEDLCEKICLLHQGKVLAEHDIYSMRNEFKKVQIAFTEEPEGNPFEGIDVVNILQNGKVYNLTIRGTEDDFMSKLEALQPAFISMLPLTLEEVFVSELGGVGYDSENIG